MLPFSLHNFVMIANVGRRKMESRGAKSLTLLHGKIFPQKIYDDIPQLSSLGQTALVCELQITLFG